MAASNHPIIRFIRMNGAGPTTPFVTMLCKNLDRPVGVAPAERLSDLIGTGDGACNRRIYTFSIDYIGANRLIPGNPQSSLPDLLTGDILRDLQSGTASLLLDDSTEACRISPGFCDAFCGVFESRGIPLKSVYLVSQNVAFIGHMTQWLADTGREPLISGYYSFFLASIAHQARKLFQGEQAWQSHTTAARQRLFGDGGIEKNFICMNNMPKPHRVAVYINLLRYGLVENGFVSFGSHQVIAKNYPHVKGMLHGVAALLDLSGPSRDELLRIATEIHEGPGRSIDREVPGVTRSGNITNDLNLDYFRKSLFTLHCETEFTNGLCRRVTEKSYKPLINFHPFVLFGDPGSLALLRGLGFKTFAPVINESYDTETDIRKRFELAWAEAMRLASMPKDELRSALRELWPVLTHNADHALNGLIDTLLYNHAIPFIQKIIRQDGPGNVQAVPSENV